VSLCVDGRVTVMLKINELENLYDQLDHSLSELEAEKAGGGSEAIQADHVFKIFRAFRKGFEKMPVHKQRDLIRAAVARVTISNEGIAHVQYYGSSQPDTLLDGSSRNAEEALLGTLDSDSPRNNESLADSRQAAHHRTLVCSSSDLVDVGG